jgi:hypothetical protein
MRGERGIPNEDEKGFAQNMYSVLMNMRRRGVQHERMRG